jgi:hypothetical protein
MNSNRKFQIIDKRPVSKDMSVWLLLGTNIAAIIWAQAATWDFITVLWVYWSQSLCIGVLWFIKMLTLQEFAVKVDKDLEFYKQNDDVIPLHKDERMGMAFGFLLFWSLFHVWFGIFLVTVLGAKGLWGIVLMSGLFVAYQTYSFFYNRKWEQRRTINIGGVIFFPFLRVAPMFFIFMVYMFWAESQPDSLRMRLAMLLFMGLKTAIDVKMHVVEQRKFE